MKKILMLGLCLVIAFSVCACSSKGGSKDSSKSSSLVASPVEDFEYEFDDGTAIITGYIGSDFDIVIPSEIENRPVVEIDAEAFEGYDLKSVVIPQSVTIIDYGAFHSCDLLEKIIVPDTLEYLGKEAFGGTLWEEKQPEGVLYINNVVVGHKGELPNEIEIKKGTVSIVNSALLDSDEDSMNYLNYDYDNDTGYKIIHIPDSVKFIGKEAVGYIEYYNRHQGDFWTRKINGCTIYGERGSVAEEYAMENDFGFVAE